MINICCGYINNQHEKTAFKHSVCPDKNEKTPSIIITLVRLRKRFLLSAFDPRLWRSMSCVVARSRHRMPGNSSSTRPRLATAQFLLPLHSCLSQPTQTCELRLWNLMHPAKIKTLHMTQLYEYPHYSFTSSVSSISTHICSPVQCGLQY